MARGQTPEQVLAEAEAYGLDLSLLRENLRLTPTERVEDNCRAVAFVEALRQAVRRKCEAGHTEGGEA